MPKYALVLILVLMECSLTSSMDEALAAMKACLNPCSNGMLPDSTEQSGTARPVSLNPCSNGMLPDKNEWCHVTKAFVLILVLMECSLTMTP